MHPHFRDAKKYNCRTIQIFYLGAICKCGHARLWTGVQIKAIKGGRARFSLACGSCENQRMNRVACGFPLQAFEEQQHHRNRPDRPWFGLRRQNIVSARV